MYKPLPQMYGGDPFDLKELTCWALEVGLNFQIEKVSADAIEFSRPIVANGHLPSDDRRHRVSLKGIACIWDQASEISPQHLKGILDSQTIDRSIVIISGRRFSELALREAARNRFWCVSRNDLDKSMSTSYPFASPLFDREEIGGILAPIKSAYLYQLNTASDQEKTYFKGGPVGKFLKPKDTIFFYVESDTTASAAILAKATIRATILDPPRNVWEQSSKRNPVFKRTKDNTTRGPQTRPKWWRSRTVISNASSRCADQNWEG